MIAPPCEASIEVTALQPVVRPAKKESVALIAVFIAASWFVALMPSVLPRPVFDAAGFVTVTFVAGFVLRASLSAAVCFFVTFFVFEAASAAAGVSASAVQIMSAVVARKPRRFAW